MAAATEASRARAGRRPRTRLGPDRLTVALLALSAFLIVLAMLATQLHAAPATARHRVVLIRRIYQTRVVETIGQGSAGATGGNSVTQSVSSASATAAPSPTTRASG